MPLDVAQQLASYAPYALYWHLTGGEPFAFPDELLDILLVRADEAPQLYTNLYTSLSSATPERFERYMGRIRCLTVSLDACSRKRYEKIKVGASFDHLLANLELAGASGIRLHANFVLTRSNLADLPHIVEFADRYGIKMLQIGRVVNTALLKRGLPEEDIFVAGRNQETDDLLYRNWTKMKADAQAVGITVFDGGVQGYLRERGYDVFDAIGET
jgi:MoaA/NifB/PqqE/SkfB family radical SAM enzyme